MTTEYDKLLELARMTKAQREDLFTDVRARVIKKEIKGKKIVYWKTRNGSDREAVNVHGTRLWSMRDPAQNHCELQAITTQALIFQVVEGRGAFFAI